MDPEQDRSMVNATKVQMWLKPQPTRFLSGSEGFVGYMSFLCSQIFYALAAANQEEAKAFELREQYQRFVLWRDCKANLDVKLNGAPHLMVAVVSSLRTLILLLSQALPFRSTTNRSDLVDEADRIMEQAFLLTGDKPYETKNSSKFNPSQYFEEVLNRIKSTIDDLSDLTPAIDNCFECYDETKPNPLQDESVRSSEQLPFVSVLAKKYPRASRSVIKRSAEANFQRMQRFYSSNTTLNIKGIFPHSAEVNSSKHTFCSDNDVKGCPSKQSETNIAQSSYSSNSVFDRPLAFGPIDKDRASGIPETTTSISLIGTSDFSAKEISLGEHLDWKKNILDYIEPYHCCFPECELGLLLFRSQEEWRNHEFQVHRIQHKWVCSRCQQPFGERPSLKNHMLVMHTQNIDFDIAEQRLDRSRKTMPRSAYDESCPFCLQRDFRSQKNFGDHVGTHMEDISLLAINPRGSGFFINKAAPDVNTALMPKTSDYTSPTSKIVYRLAKCYSSIVTPFRDLRNFIRWRNQIKSSFCVPILLWSQDNEVHDYFIAEFDTGTSDNFIGREIVERLRLEIKPLAPGQETVYMGLNNLITEVSDFVQPRWQMEENRKRFKDVRFLVVNQIPESDIILGTSFIRENKCLKKVLINKSDRSSAKLSPAEQAQYDKQSSDDKARRAQRQKKIEHESNPLLQKQAGTDTAAQTSKTLHNGAYK